MHLKYPSLLKFDQDCARDKENLHNLASFYRIKQVVSDTYLRSLLDPIKLTHFRKIVTILLSYVKRSKRRKQFEFLDEGYLVPIDGTGHFASGKMHCKECGIKKANSKNSQYYHQRLAACTVKLGKKEVIPLMPEPITQQIEASPNSYGYGEQHLATNFAHLTFIAFLIDQIEQMTCLLFQKALLASKSKKHYGTPFEGFLIGLLLIHRLK